MNNNRYRFGNLLGYVDIVMNLLMGFIVLFIFAFMLMKVDTSKNKNPELLKYKAKVIIHLHWDDKSNTDLDLWVRSSNPTNIVSFRQKESPNMWLDHDSQGASSNKVTMADGTVKETFGNDEVVQFKECTNTRVNVNIHTYNTSDDKSTFPLPATVEVIMPTSFKRVLTKTLLIPSTVGGEVTAFSFNLNEQCKISDVDENTYVPFVYDVLNQNNTPSTPNSTAPSTGGSHQNTLEPN